MIPGPSIDQHHLIPKSKGGKIQEDCHKVCHRKIHSRFTESELAFVYNTWDNLRAHPDIQTFVRWVKKKPPEFLDSFIRSKDKRK